ncbi:MAG: metalloenzyme [Actinobacteria bacterium]|nr:metalloenzyme [Actinomycetota bacterium]
MISENYSRKEFPQHVLMIFVDGLGIGEDDTSINPCADKNVSLFNHFLSDDFPKRLDSTGYAIGLDATLGMPGLPQSATGQTALLTGVNAARLLGRHLNHFPNQRLREVIAEKSIFKQFTRCGCKAAFLNTFRPPFFDYDPHEIIKHLAVTTVANLYANLPFFKIDDLLQERSVYHDMTNMSLRELGFDVPLFTPKKAGKIIGKQTTEYHFCLYEYFLTDKAGHSRDLDRALKEISKLEEFLYSVLENVDLNDTLVLLTSDHGNIEDISVKGHTRNPAMTLIFGKGKDDLFPHLHSLSDVARELLNLNCKH